MPREFSLDAYRLIFLNPAKILRSYGVTLFVTGVGTAISLFCSVDGRLRALPQGAASPANRFAFFLYFTQLFNGGLVPYYLLISAT